MKKIYLRHWKYVIFIGLMFGTTPLFAQAANTIYWVEGFIREVTDNPDGSKTYTVNVSDASGNAMLLPVSSINVSQVRISNPANARVNGIVIRASNLYFMGSINTRNSSGNVVSIVNFADANPNWRSVGFFQFPSNAIPEELSGTWFLSRTVSENDWDTTLVITNNTIQYTRSTGITWTYTVTHRAPLANSENDSKDEYPLGWGLTYTVTSSTNPDVTVGGSPKGLAFFLNATGNRISFIGRADIIYSKQN